ncbi:MAG: transposase [Candidatus Falkowbacteria bacterium]
MKKSFKISTETKEQILKRVKEEGLPVAKVAEEHGISTATIYGWLSKGVKAQPSWSELSKLRKQNHELLALVGELTISLSQTKKKT